MLTGSAQILCLFSVCFWHACAEPACLGHTFERHEAFGQKYDLFWTIDKARREISLCMQANTLGWVAFGISQTGGMVGADIFRGFFDGEESHLEDSWSTVLGKPEQDIEQDWKLVRAHRNETHTGFHGRRPLESCDEQDLPFSAVPSNVIWAFGSKDAFTQHLPEDRGGGRVSFFVSEQGGLDGEQVIDVVAPRGITFPAKQTMYQCAFVAMPVAANKRMHITSYELIPGESVHMHHQHIYRCPSGTEHDYGVGLNTFFDCTDAMPDDCVLTLTAATGMKKINGWSEAGVPVGGTDEDCTDKHNFRCFRLGLIEVHLENKLQPLGPIVDPLLGFRIYVTERLREHDLGVMKLGVPHTDIVIPPGQTAVTVSNECSAVCTAARLSEPLNLVLMAPHMHGLGSRYVVHHIRGGEEIAEFGVREFGWTDTITALDVVNAKLLPGDRLVLECTYDSTSRTQETRGGKRRADEMCDAYFGVYPFEPGLSVCLGTAPALPDRQYCGPAERQVWEGIMGAGELEAFAADAGYPLLPYTPETFTLLDDIPDKAPSLCAAVARSHVSDPQDMRAIVVGPAVIILGYVASAHAVGAVLRRRSERYRQMSEPNQRNVQAYMVDIAVCVIVLGGVLAYRGWSRDSRAVAEWAGPIASVSGNVLIWTYVATLTFRSKVHVSTVGHHVATVVVILLTTIGGYHHGAEQYNKVGAVLLLMAVSDGCGFVALILHRFGSPSAAPAFLASTVWNLISKTSLFVVYWLVADIYPGRIRSYLDRPWSEEALGPLFRVAVTTLYLLQSYQTYVFYQMYLRLRGKAGQACSNPSDSSPDHSAGSSSEQTPAESVSNGGLEAGKQSVRPYESEPVMVSARAAMVFHEAEGQV